jgi:hypothetical protein
MSLKNALFLVLLALLPVDGTPFLRIEIADVSLSLLDLMIVGLLFLDFLEGSLGGFGVPRFVWIVEGWVLLAAILSTVSLLFLESSGIAYDVKITLNFLELIAMILLTARAVRDPAALRLAFRAMLAGALVLSVATILKSAGFDIPGDVRQSARYRLGPFLVGVTGLVSRGVNVDLALVAAFPAALASEVIGRAVIRIPLAATIAFAGLLTYSRNCWVSLSAELVAALLLFPLARGKKTARLFVGILVGGLMLGALASAGRIYEFIVLFRPRTVLVRFAGFAHGLTLATHDPFSLLFGVGKERFAETFEAETFGVPHNFFLDLLVSKGLLTTIAFLVPLVILVRRLMTLVSDSAASSERRRLAAVCLTFLAGVATSGMFAPIMTSLCLLAAIALATALLCIEEPGAEPR